MLMHILSPYPGDRSALTDCRKLRESGLPFRKAILIYGFDAPGRPLGPALDAFEHLARADGPLSDRHVAVFEGLAHPVHVSGAVVAWELGNWVNS
jgi:hypothetical protein